MTGPASGAGAPAAAAPTATAASSEPTPAAEPAKAAAPAAGAAASAATSSIALPGGPPVSMDYLAYDPATNTVWAPAGNTGRVDVVDAASGKVTEIGGFETAKFKDRLMGPSSVSPGEGMIYVGNRAGSAICAIDPKTMKKGACVTLPTMPDGVAYVATTHEIWVTTPRNQTLTVLDAKNAAAPAIKTTIKLDGDPEGYAVDPQRGLFYTNLEDKDRTLVLDVKTHKVVATWNPECGEKGPRGLAIDLERQQLFVACTESVKTLDAAHGGKILGTVETGAGVDNIDYLQSKRTIYAAAGRAGTLTLATVDAAGALHKTLSVPGAAGGRVVVVDSAGTAYIADSTGGRLVVVKPPAQ